MIERAPVEYAQYVDNLELAEIYCRFVSIGGIQDWRLPTVTECLPMRMMLLGGCAPELVNGSGIIFIWHSDRVPDTGQKTKGIAWPVRDVVTDNLEDT
jgi:hypothetical protein